MNNYSSNYKEKIDESLKDYYDAYTVFLITRKYNIDTIKYNRMNAVIDNYIYYKNINDDEIRKSLLCYYTYNIKDDIVKNVKPKPCFFVKARLERQAYEKIDKYEMETDDVKNHYKEVNDKYKYYYEESIKVINDDNYSEAYIENEYSDEDDYNSDYNSDYYYDEYDTDYSTDYLSDEY
jgi:hypothetical protein